MSDNTISDVRAGVAEKKSPRANSLADHPLVQLTLVRFLEFMREPEALFWVFVFPVLLAAGLGIAFRNRPAEVLRIAVVTPELAQSLRQEKLLDVQQLDSEAAQEALRTGKVALLAAPGSRGTVEYRYDDTNPEGRAARLLADRAIQTAAGRVDPVATSDQLMRESGFALHRFPDSRIARHESDGQRDLVDGIRDRRCAAQKTFEAPGGEPHAPALLFAFVSALADFAAGRGSGSARWIRRFAFPRACSRFARWISRSCVSWLRFLSARWDSCWPRVPERLKRLPA